MDGIGRAGVIGAGVMGSEIAEVLAEAGAEVVLVDVDRAALERGLGLARAAAERRARRGRLDPDAVAPLLARITTATEDGALAGCDLAIEAVPEVMDLKRAVMGRLDAALPPDALLATNTSGLSVTELGRATSRPGSVVGLHFFNPASVMALVEVVRGEDTTDAAAERAASLARAAGKTPVAVRECPGFLVNRILVRAMAAAYAAASAAGVSAAEADAAVVERGPAPMGPFALGDLIGLDTLEHIRSDLAVAYGDRYDDSGTLAPLVAAGRLGRKTGGGLVPADAGSPAPGPAAAGVAEAYYSAAADEALRCVDERVAGREDADLAMRLGAGWSAGPLEGSA